jgi:hypothetical protein
LNEPLGLWPSCLRSSERTPAHRATPVAGEQRRVAFGLAHDRIVGDVRQQELAEPPHAARARRRGAAGDVRRARVGEPRVEARAERGAGDVGRVVAEREQAVAGGAREARVQLGQRRPAVVADLLGHSSVVEVGAELR